MQSSSLNNIIGCPNYEGALHVLRFGNLDEFKKAQQGGDGDVEEAV